MLSRALGVCRREMQKTVRTSNQFVSTQATVGTIRVTLSKVTRNGPAGIRRCTNAMFDRPRRVVGLCPFRA